MDKYLVVNFFFLFPVMWHGVFVFFGFKSRQTTKERLINCLQFPRQLWLLYWRKVWETTINILDDSIKRFARGDCLCKLKLKKQRQDTKRKQHFNLYFKAVAKYVGISVRGGSNDFYVRHRRKDKGNYIRKRKYYICL